VNESWTGNNVGDLHVGMRVNLLSKYRRAPMALAVRGMVMLPTGDDDAGVSAGKTDVMADLIGSRELARFFETAIHAGYERRGEPDGFNAPATSFSSRAASCVSRSWSGSSRKTHSVRPVVGPDAQEY
jgi:hypothetical protein